MTNKRYELGVSTQTRVINSKLLMMTLVWVKMSNLKTIAICQNPRMVHSKIRVIRMSIPSHLGIFKVKRHEVKDDGEDNYSVKK